jgi:hypothetical protein
MGITTEQYRARVGSHVNFLREREVARRLKGAFWNTMFMLSYLNVFYLPILKQINEQYNKSNEAVAWFFKNGLFSPSVCTLLAKIIK